MYYKYEKYDLNILKLLSFVKQEGLVFSPERQDNEDDEHD
jgi:hypothetical protein